MDLVGVAANAATTIGVLVAAWQLWLARRQGMTSFEDAMAKEYRELAASLPTKALLGEPLSEAEQRDRLDEFYRYFDLCNQQVFLHREGRISRETWGFWEEGIRTNLDRPAFARAWAEVAARANGDFAELKTICPPGPWPTDAEKVADEGRS